MIKMNKSYFEEWYRVRAYSCAIENCSTFRVFSSDIKNVYKVHTLLTDNRKSFRKIFGKPDTYWKGSEFYFHVWIREFQGEKFIVLTAVGKGTCIEICDTSFEGINKKSKVIMLFIEDLLYRLSV